MSKTAPPVFPSAPSVYPALSTRLVGVVLALASAARLLVLASLASHSAVTWVYGRGLETGFVAHALLGHEGFASPFGGHTGPTALISPGYVLLVTAVFRLFGDASAASAIVILLAQIALGVLTVWVVLRLADRLAGRNAALLAGCFFALWPPLLWVPTIFWDTSLTLCLLPTLLLLALRLREHPTRSLWLGFGAVCGFALLVNLALCVSVFAVFCWAAWYAGARRGNVVLAAAIVLFMYAPWPLRNARAFHAFIPLRTTVGLELWMGNREGATGFLDESVFPLYNRAELDRYLSRGEVAYMQEKSAAAVAAIQRHPHTFAALTAKRFVRFWFGTGTRGGSWIYTLGAALTTLFGMAGLVTLFCYGDRPAAWLCALPLLLFPLPYYITHAEFRYRLALDPMLTALAAAFAVALASASRSRPAASTLPTTALPADGTVVHA